MDTKQRPPRFVVVLGKKLNPDGSPKSELIERVHLACQIFLHEYQDGNSPLSLPTFFL